MRNVLCLAMASLLAVAAPAAAQTAAERITKAQAPGAGQERLNAMVGNFDVTISIWVTPKSVPIVSNAAGVGRWVMDGRFVETHISGFVLGERFDALNYAGYNNASNSYQATWLDNRSTEQGWYTGNFGADGRTALLSGSVTNPANGKAEPVELRMTVDNDGNRVTELWGRGGGKTMFKLMELRFVRSK